MNRTALVVSSNRMMSRLYDALLGSLGWTTRHVSTCSGARAVLEADRPALALVELELADGAGTEILAMLRNCAPAENLPVIAVGLPSSVAREATQAAGATLLAKPVDLNELASLVQLRAGSDVGHQ